MKYVNFLNAMYFMVVGASSELDDRSKDSWYFPHLVNVKNKKMTVEFDFLTSLDFLNSYNSEISTFSPICVDYNIFIQRYNLLFDFKSRKIPLRELEKMKHSLKFLNTNVFFLTHCFREPVYLSGDQNEGRGGKSKKNKNKNKKKKKKGNRNNRVNKDSIVLEYELPNKKSSIVTEACFVDELVNKFEQSQFSLEEYKNRSHKVAKRIMMNATGAFKFGEGGENDQMFNVIALPYKEKIRERFTRYLVYIIPKNDSIVLSNLWNYFYDFSNKNIKEMIENLKETNINLSVPIGRGFENVLTHLSNFKKIVKYTENSLAKCEMKATVTSFDNTAELGETNFEKLQPFTPDNDFPCVCGKDEFISLIYDTKLERILFFKGNRKD